MEGYWKAIDPTSGKVWTGRTPDEAYDNAVREGADPNAVIVEYQYDQARAGI